MKHTTALFMVAFAGWLALEDSADGGGNRHFGDNGGAWGNYAEFGYHGGDPYYRSSAYGPAGGLPIRQRGDQHVGHSENGSVTRPMRQPALAGTCCRPIAQCCSPMTSFSLAVSP